MPVLVAAILVFTLGACHKARGPKRSDGLPIPRGGNITGGGIQAD